MAAEFGAAIELRDNFTSPVEKAISGVHRFGTSAASATSSSTSFQSANNKLVGTLKAIVGAAAGALAINGIKDAYNKCVTAAETAQQSTTRFTTLMNNVPGTTKATISSLTDYAATLANTGVVSKGVTVAGAGQLATFQLQGNTIKTLLPALDDLIVSQKGVNGTQSDAIGLANLVGKAMTGSTGALTKYGVTLTAAQTKMIKHGTETQRASAVAQALEANYGNLNKAMVNTAAGGAARMQNQISAMKVSIGKQLIPIQESLISTTAKILPVVSPIITSVAAGVGSLAQKALPPLQSAFTNVSNFVQSHLPQIKATANDVFGAVGKVVQTATGIFTNILLPILKGVANFVQSNMPQIKGTFVTALSTVDSVVKTAASIFTNLLLPSLQDIWNFVKPYMPQIEQLVQTAFGAIQKIVKSVGAAFQATTGFIKQHWAIFAPILVGISAAAIAFGVYSAAIAVWSAVTAIATGVGAAFGAVLAIITSPIGIVVLAIAALAAAAFLIIKNWSPISAFFSNLWDGIVSTFKGVINFFVSGINDILSGINSVTGVISKVTGTKLTIPLINAFANGTSNFKGGTALVGEKGPELVTMPKGSAVHTASETKQILGGSNSSNAAQKNLTVNMAKMADQIIVREEADIDKIATAFVTKLQKAWDAGIVPG